MHVRIKPISYYDQLPVRRLHTSIWKCSIENKMTIYSLCLCLCRKFDRAPVPLYVKPFNNITLSIGLQFAPTATFAFKTNVYQQCKNRCPSVVLRDKWKQRCVKQSVVPSSQFSGSVYKLVTNRNISQSQGRKE